MDFTWDESDEAYRAELREVIATLPDDWRENYAPQGPSSPKVMDRARQFNARLAERDLMVRRWPVADLQRQALAVSVRL